MELNELKSTWKKAGDTSKSESDLQRMTEIRNHPSLKAIRRKLIVESIAVCFLLFFWYNMFDGDKKPFFANLLLASSMLLYVFNNVISYLSLQKQATGADIRKSIHEYLVRIKRLALFSLIISFLYGGAFVTFFSVVIEFTTQKYLILAGITVTLALSVYVSQRLWRERINRLRSHLEYFGQDQA